ncbi:EAL domain-containing protein [Thalassotalea ganghwensis]
MDSCQIKVWAPRGCATWLFGLFSFFIASPSVAQSLTSTAVHRLFIDQYFSFVLGMTLPVLVIFALLKPITGMRLRYPFIISASILNYLYALNYSSEFQQTILLISAATLVCALTFGTLIERVTNKSQSLTAILTGGLYLTFIGLVIMANTLNMHLIWLAYNVVNLILVAVLMWFLQRQALIKVFHESLIWVVVTGFAVVNYLWLTASVSDSILIVAIVVVYLLYMINYCWRLSQRGLVNYQQESDRAIAATKHNEINSGFDPITNLPGYNQALSALKRALPNQQNALAIIVFKPVNFAQVNRVLGHHNSDILLLQFAYSLQKSIAEDPMLINFHHGEMPVKIARLQGLDFMVALDTSASTHPETILIEQLCQKLKKSVPNAMSFKSFSLNFELHFGVAISSEHTRIEQTISCAGDALLSGEHSEVAIHYYQQSSALYTEQRLRQMEALKQDIVGGKLTWNIKPQVSFIKNQLIGFEVVSNWRFQEQNRLNNQEFIQVAEYSGEIYRLTCQLIEQACQLINVLHKDNFAVQICINLSSKDVLEHDLVDFIEKTIDKHDAPIRYLVVEIDEHLVFEASDKTKRIIAQLKAIGAKVAINKFSGSYEALRYLRRMSIDYVKIDCSHLIGSLEGSTSEKTIINALINLIRKMKLPLIATGIDNSEIKNTYTNIGGDIGQGQLIAKNIPIEDAENWTSQWFLKALEGKDNIIE